MNIILLGAQGSGKGTQAHLLKEKYDLVHISTGDLLREAAAKDPKIAQQLTTGKLFSDKQIIALIKEKINDKGIIFDGFPRTLPQAEALDEITQIDFVIELKIPDSESVKRLSSRRQCKQCKAIFGAENPPRTQGKCNRCLGELYQREDDKPEAIKKRLQQYHDETEPLLEYYRPRKIVHSVDGTKKIEDIFKDLCGIIDQIAGG
jgi:adenylate kinase